MSNDEKILALLEGMNQRFDSIDQRLDKVEQRLDKMEGDIEELKEYAEINRTGVNALLDWAEACTNVIQFPLPKVK